MTFEELCAYAIAARNYHSFYLREQAVAIVNTISESLAPRAVVAEDAHSYDDFLQAMGGV